MMKITYYHTLYKKEVTVYTDTINFTADAIHFAAAGHEERIEHIYVRKVEVA